MSRDNRIEGFGSITAGNYDKVSIEGMGKVKEDITCKELIVGGMYKSKGKVETEKFECNGMSNIFEDLKAKEVKINGMVRIKGAKLEAEDIFCNGMLTCTEEVSADKVIVEGNCSIGTLYGDQIKITQPHGNASFKIPGIVKTFGSAYIGRRVSQEYSIVDIIECTDLQAEYLESKLIRAHKVVLGPYCKVEKIECDGELIYDETCQIGKIEAGQVTRQSNTNNVNEGETDMADIKLTKILDLYKEGQINADEAEKMLKGLGALTQTTAQITSSNFSDDKLRVVVMRGNRAISQHEYQKGMTIEVAYQGDVAAVECWGNLTCSNVEGAVHVGGDIHSANIEGNAKAGGSINCKNIEGDIKCGGSVNCKDVGGNISAGGGVRLSK